VTRALFAHPEWLEPAAAALALALAWSIASALHARGRWLRLTGERAPLLRSGLARDLALVAALVAIALAALGPRLGMQLVESTGGGVDVVVLVDVSASMNARDVPPSRLARAHRVADRLLAGLEPGDRAALAAFAGRGVLLTPLTRDAEALREMLPSLDAELMRPRGSQLDEGVRAALEAFAARPGAGSHDRPRVLFVVSDGEDPARGDTGEADALRAGARVVAVALGSAAGAAVEEHGLPLRDAVGRAVISRSHPERLAELAAATDGELLATDAFGDVDPERALAAVRRDAARAPGAPSWRRVREPRAAPLAALALALLLAEAWLGRDRTAQPRRGLARAAGAALAVCAAALVLAPRAGVAEAGSGDAGPDAASAIAYGIAEAEAGRLESAREAFAGAAVATRDPALAALAYYDLGVAELERRDYAAARDAFFDALGLLPAGARHAHVSAEQVRFNLEWALRALSAAPPEGGAQPPPLGEPTPETPDDGGSEPEPSRGDAVSDPARDEQSMPDAALRPSPDPRRASQSGAEPVPLEPGEAERWLDSVADDPGRSLRRTARDAAGTATRTAPEAPTW
jgi:Ca-activated chloride channel family protein